MTWRFLTERGGGPVLWRRVGHQGLRVGQGETCTGMIGAASG